MRIASVIAWTVVGVTATGWLAVAVTAYLSGNCHGMQECYGRALFLNDVFWLFFAVGVLIDGTEWVMRWWRRRSG
jgi:hypothetical protein